MILSYTLKSLQEEKFSNSLILDIKTILIIYLLSKFADKTKSEFVRLGVVQGYSWRENKQMEQIFELGSDIPYYVPGRTTGSIQIQRVLLSGEDLLNAVYQDNSVQGVQANPNKWIRSLRDINIPMDLLFVFYGEGSTGKYDARYTRLFKNSWIQARQEQISAGQILVAESVSIVYEYCSNYNYAKK
mgnify:CR=1 FL=1